MIKMQNHFYKNEIYSSIRKTLVGLLIIIISFSIVFFMIQYYKTKSNMESDVVQIFEKSIEEDLSAKMDREHSTFQISNRPTKKNAISERTIILDDTIIKKKMVLKDQKSEVSNSFMTYLRFNNRLHADTLSSIFQNNLRNNDINATSFVLLIYDDKTEISGDTTDYSLSFRTPELQRGFMNEITFQGLISYTPLSIIQVLPLYLFFVFIVVIFLISASIFYLSKKINAIQPDKIIKLKNGDFYIGLIYFNRDKKILRNENKIKTLPPLIAGILEFFLDSEDYTANKDQLQNKFWQSSTSYNSMTSSINRLRDYLKDVDSTFKIITAKGGDFYILEYNIETKN